MADDGAGCQPASSRIAHANFNHQKRRSKIEPEKMPKPALSSIFCFGRALTMLILFIAPARAQETRVAIDSLRVKENFLVIDFHVDSLLTSHLLNGMQRGLTSSAQFRVQLWRKRSRWFGSTMMAERRYEIKSTYDPWEQKYMIVTAGERRLTSALDLMRRWWEQHRGVALAEAKEFNPGRHYFITIELLVEPVSKESLNEIRSWLAGGVKAAARRDSTMSDSTAAANETKRDDFPERLLNLLVNLTGFGRQVITAQSGIFGINESGKIELEK
jgi:hypothetical protein